VSISVPTATKEVLATSCLKSMSKSLNKIEIPKKKTLKMKKMSAKKRKMMMKRQKRTKMMMLMKKETILLTRKKMTSNATYELSASKMEGSELELRLLDQWSRLNSSK
jgi:hypothetical protein